MCRGRGWEGDVCMEKREGGVWGGGEREVCVACTCVCVGGGEGREGARIEGESGRFNTSNIAN